MESEKRSNLSRVQLYPQYLTGLGISLIMLELGIMVGWSSPYLERLTGINAEPFYLTDEQKSWVASLLNAGRFLGALSGAILINFLGSKNCLTMSILPTAGCWILTIFADSYIWLYAARAIGGYGLGLTYSCMALYVGEVALPEIRGGLISIAMSGGSSIGAVISSVCGRYYPMHLTAACFLIPCAIAIVLLAWLPDSPFALAKKGKDEEAEEAIAWYQPGQDPTREVTIVKNLVANDKSLTFREKIEKLKSPAVKQALIHIFALFTFMQLAGLNTIIFFMQEILRKSGISDPASMVIYVNITSFFTGIASCILIDRFGRRFLLILSSCGVAMAMACLTTNSYLIENNYNVNNNLQWLPVISIFLYINAFFVGLMCVPSTVLSEIFPSDVKSIAGCFASLVGAFWSFMATKSFTPLMDIIGPVYVYGAHGICALLIIPYVLIFLPETKAKSLKEIQDQLTGDY
ncbi:hypothetical protein TKK_0001064 [Trichogramma kaykai]|uniref:Major facilitator superfamily (MFS) profile domain-containing protein n=1 Tax=Trichogramma kaykai TaxID=54128 RepID=A0ABD2WS57_9HYME